MTHFPVWAFPSTLILGVVGSYLTTMLSRTLFGYDLLAEWKKGKAHWTLKTSLVTLTWVYFIAWTFLSVLVTLIVLGAFTEEGAAVVGHIAELSFNIAASSHSSTIFLIIAYVAVKARNRLTAPMLSESEIKTSVVYSVVSLILYPTWQMVVLASGVGIDSLFFVVAPQFFYSIELTLSAAFLARLRYNLGQSLGNTAELSRTAAATTRVIMLGQTCVIVAAFLQAWTFLVINCFMVSNVEMNVILESVMVFLQTIGILLILPGTLFIANARPISIWWTAVYAHTTAKGATAVHVVNSAFLELYSDADGV